MAHFLLVRPPQGARQLWHLRAGCPSELVAPLVQHRRRFGDLYDWGADTPGALLLSATLLNRVGIPAGPAALLAPALVGEIVETLTGDLIHLDASELGGIATELVSANVDALLGQYCGKGGRNGA